MEISTDKYDPEKNPLLSLPSSHLEGRLSTDKPPSSPSLSARYSSVSTSTIRTSTSSPPASPLIASPSYNSSSIANAAHILQLQAQLLNLQAQFLLNPELQQGSALTPPSLTKPRKSMDETDEKISERTSFTEEARKPSERGSVSAAEVEAILTKVMTSPPKRSNSLQSRKSQDAKGAEDGRRSTSYINPKRTSLFIPTDLNTPVARKRSSPRMQSAQDRSGVFQHFIALTPGFWQVLNVLKFRIELEATVALEFTNPKDVGVGVTVIATSQSNLDHGVRLINSVIRDDRPHPVSNSPRLSGRESASKPGSSPRMSGSKPASSPRMSASKPGSSRLPKAENSNRGSVLLPDIAERLSQVSVSSRESVIIPRGSAQLESPPGRPDLTRAGSGSRGSNHSPEPLSSAARDRQESISSLAAEVRTLLEQNRISMGEGSGEVRRRSPSFTKQQTPRGSQTQTPPMAPVSLDSSRQNGSPKIARRPTPDGKRKSTENRLLAGDDKRKSLGRSFTPMSPAACLSILASCTALEPLPSRIPPPPPLKLSEPSPSQTSSETHSVHSLAVTSPSPVPPEPAQSPSPVVKLIPQPPPDKPLSMSSNPEPMSPTAAKSEPSQPSNPPAKATPPPPPPQPASPVATSVSIPLPCPLTVKPLGLAEEVVRVSDDGSNGRVTNWMKRSQVKASEKKDLTRSTSYRNVPPAPTGTIITRHSESDLSRQILDLKAESTQTHPFGTVMSGVLSKRGKGRIKSWQKRLFLLTRSRLWYYKGNKSLKLALDITGDTVLQLLPSGEFLVGGSDKEHTYYLTASTEQEKMEWLEAINALIEDDKASHDFATRFGEVELRLWFDEDANTLNVIILRGRKIQANLSTGKFPANSYVTVAVTDDKKPHKSVKTATVRNSAEPVWKEPFSFALHDAVLTVQTLAIRVVNEEKGKSVVLGILDIPLLNVPFEEKEAVNTWYALLPDKKPLLNVGSPVMLEPSLGRSGSTLSSSSLSPTGLPRSRSFGPTLSRSSSSMGSFSRSSLNSSPSHSHSHARVGSASRSFLDQSPIKLGPSESFKASENDRVANASFRKSSTRTSASEISRFVKEEEVKLPGPPVEDPQLGTMHVSVWYDTPRELLWVELKQCCGLPSSNLVTFVELKLIPVDPQAPQTVKTKVQRKTADPLFEEYFEFGVEQSKLGFKLLSLSVMERGGTFGKDKMIGEVLIPLDTVPRSSAGAMQARPIAAVSSIVFEISQLGDLLLLEAGFQSFLTVLTKEHSRENLLFWKAVQDFRFKYLDAGNDLRPVCMQETVAIVRKYIQSGAELEINVPSTIKNHIQAALSDERSRTKHTCETLASIFDFAQAEVLDLMSRDTFSRYLVSKEWTAFCDYLAQEKTEKELGYRVVNSISAYNQTLRSKTTNGRLSTSTSTPGLQRLSSASSAAKHSRVWSHALPHTQTHLSMCTVTEQIAISWMNVISASSFWRPFCPAEILPFCRSLGWTWDSLPKAPAGQRQDLQEFWVGRHRFVV